MSRVSPGWRPAEPSDLRGDIATSYPRRRRSASSCTISPFQGRGRTESLHIHSRFCAAAQDHCIFTVCRDIAKLDGSKLDFDPRLQEFFLGGRGGGQHGPKKLERRPGSPRGSTRGGPVLRRRRSRITAYLQSILSTGASQEGPLKIGLGPSANIRRSRITAYMAAPALRRGTWRIIAACIQCPVN